MRIGRLLRYAFFYGAPVLALAAYKASDNINLTHLQRPAISAECVGITDPHNASPKCKRELTVTKRIDEIFEQISNINLFVWHPKDFSQKRIQLSKLYLELASLDKGEKGKKRKEYLKQALAEIDGADQIADEGFQFGAEGKYVREYFDVLFAIGAASAGTGDYDEALKIFERVISELQDKPTRLAQQVHEYSVPGYTNRAKLEIAQVYLKQSKLAQAKPLLDEVIDWSRREAAEDGFTLFYRDENLKDLHFLEAKSLVSRGRIALFEKNYAWALQNFADVFQLEEAGSEDGFMDVGFEALVFGEQTCLAQHPTDLNAAKADYKQAFPWSKINGYSDFKAAMESDMNFADPESDVWDTVMIGLTKYPLQQDAEAALKKVILFSTRQ